MKNPAEEGRRAAVQDIEDTKRMINNFRMNLIGMLMEDHDLQTRVIEESGLDPDSDRSIDLMARAAAVVAKEIEGKK